MNGDRAASIAFILLALTLPLSALIARQMRMRRALPMALLWMAIIGGLAMAIGFVERRPQPTPSPAHINPHFT